MAKANGKHQKKHLPEQANGKHRKKRDPEQAQTCLTLFHTSLLSANELFKLVEAIQGHPLSRVPSAGGGATRSPAAFPAASAPAPRQPGHPLTRAPQGGQVRQPAPEPPRPHPQDGPSPPSRLTQNLPAQVSASR